MRKMLFGALLSAALCFLSYAPSIFSAAYADDRAVTSEQVTLSAFVIDNFDTVCAVDATAKHEEDFRHDERMSIDVITQSERNLHHDSVWLLGLNNQYLQNQYLRQ